MSFAPNREDVVLYRALADVHVGQYLEVGIRGPVTQSIGHAFARRGWTGATIESGRPADRAAAPGGDLHFVVVDAATPAERIALLGRVLPDSARPWVIVLRDGAAVVPIRPDPAELEAFDAQGYEPCLNDGISIFLVDGARSEDLRDALSRPANILDAVVYERDLVRDDMLADLTRRIDELSAQLREHDEANLAALLDWRRFAIDAWARAATASRRDEMLDLRKQIELNFNHIRVVDDEIDRLRSELDALQRTLSWRVTRPLRRVRGMTRRGTD